MPTDTPTDHEHNYRATAALVAALRAGTVEPGLAALLAAELRKTVSQPTAGAPTRPGAAERLQ